MPHKDKKNYVEKLISNSSDNKKTSLMSNNATVTDTVIDPLQLLNTILETESYSFIAKKLNVALGTVKRWSELKSVPKSYTFDLMKLAHISIDYSLFSFKEKDQFFTPKESAKYCYTIFLKILKDYGDSEADYTYIEPSAGNGNFLKILPSNRRIGLDIEPRNAEIEKRDYLEWSPSEDKKYIVIGNPPFGLRGQLALKFINHSIFADYVCFILPQLFESDGKGVPRKRVEGFNLIHSEKIQTDFESPDGMAIPVECIFQVWSKFHNNPNFDIKQADDTVIKIYSLSDGGTPSTTRNKKMFNKCDIYLPSTCFGKDNMRYYATFDELPRKKGYGIVFNKNRETNLEKFKTLDWSKIAFLSTNSAYNIRTSQIQIQFENQ